jgi:hypothetical protein
MKNNTMRNMTVLACIISTITFDFYVTKPPINTYVNLNAYNYTPKITEPKVIERYDPLLGYKTPEFQYDIDYEQLRCLALNVYFEARGESHTGQHAVAWVTFNRVDSPLHPNTVCDVVWQKNQFSWTHDGKSDKTKDRLSWKIALYIALDVYKDHIRGYSFNDPTKGATMFHASYVNPKWQKDFEKTAQIDNHVFYK